MSSPSLNFIAESIDFTALTVIGGSYLPNGSCAGTGVSVSFTVDAAGEDKTVEDVLELQAVTSHLRAPT